MNLDNIYNEHSKMVYNLALQYVQNIEEAEEITQDVFVKAFQKQESFKQLSSISTWLYRITINTSLDYLKAKKTQKRFVFITNLFYHDSNEVKHNKPTMNHPGIELEHKEAFENIFKNINTLPENQKTALILMKIECLSQVETAEIMNLTPKAVESLVQRAKSTLVDKLKNNEGKK